MLNLSVIDRRQSKTLNLMLMIGSFGAGQGAVFLVQTWLVARNELSLLANFGMHFSVAILVVLIVDWGGLTVLARQTVQTIGAETDNRRAIWRLYWNITAFRIMVALIATGCIGGFAVLFGGSFTRTYVAAALPVAMLWAFNTTGLLDGLRMSGLSGLTGSPPYIFSAAALLLVIDRTPETAGLMLGGALTLGYATAIVGQFTALLILGKGIRWVRPRLEGMLAAGRSGAGALFTILPGQIYFRIQLGLSATMLGEAATAILIYAKQVVSAVLLMGSFLRRIEFPDLVESVRHPSINILSAAYSTQKVGTAFGLCAFVVVLACSLVAAVVLTGSSHDAARALSWYSVLIASGSLSLGATQTLLALGLYKLAASCSLTALGVGVIVSAVLTTSLGVLAFPLADLSANLLTLVVSLVILVRFSQTRKSAPVEKMKP